jgi:hypothetical protein
MCAGSTWTRQSTSTSSTSCTIGWACPLHSKPFLRVWDKLEERLVENLIAAIECLRQRGNGIGDEPCVDPDGAWRVAVAESCDVDDGDSVRRLLDEAQVHAHDHRLPVHHFESRLEVAHEVFRDQSQAAIGANEGFERRPFRLELLLPLKLLALGNLIEGLV